MKNFFKKLSFVLASAMVITSLYAPANAKAASKNFLRTKGSKKAAKSVTLFLNNKGVNFDYTFGKMTKGLKGTWKVSDSDVLAIGKKTGYVKAKAPGKATVSFTTMLGKKKVTVKSTVMVKAVPATALILDETKFDVKLNESLTVIPKFSIADEFMALGVKNSSDKLFASSDNSEVASVSVVNNNLIIKGLKAGKANISFYAAASKDAETKVEGTKFEVSVIGDLAAEQTAANKITVKGADLTTVAKDYEIKNSKGDVLPIKDPVEVNAEKTEAVITGTTEQIPVEKYTLKFGTSTTEFAVEKAEIKAIKFMPENEAVYGEERESSAPYSIQKYVAYAYYRIYDQFGTDVTDSYRDSDVVISGSYNAKKTNIKGQIKFESPKEAPFVIGVTPLSVTVVDVKRGISETAMLKISNEAMLWEADFAGILDTTTMKFVDSNTIYDDIKKNDKYLNYRILFTAKDQYGKDFYGTTVSRGSVNGYAPRQLQVAVIDSLTGISVETDMDKAKVMEVNGKKYLSYHFKIITDTMRFGDATLLYTVLNNGTQKKEKFDVLASEKVDKIEIYEGTKGVYALQDNTLGYRAYDTNGKLITKWSVLKEMNKDKRLQAGEAGIYFEQNDKGVVELHFNLEGVNSIKPSEIYPTRYNVSARTITNNFFNGTLEVKAERRPVSIIGLKADTDYGVSRVSGNDLAIPVDKVIFQDQFGGEMSAGEVITYNNRNKVEIPPSSGTYVYPANLVSFYNVADADFTAQTNDFLAKAPIIDKTKNVVAVTPDTSKLEIDKAGSATVKLMLHAKDSDNVEKLMKEYSFEIHNVGMDKMTGFDVATNGLRPAADLDNDGVNNSVKITATGKFSGRKIKLVTGTDYEVFGALNPADGTLDPTKNFNFTPGLLSIPSNTNSAEAYGKVVTIESEPEEIPVKYTYSKEARRVAKIALGNGIKDYLDFTDTTTAGKEIGTNAIAHNQTVKFYDFTTSKGIKNQLEISDQYGLTLSATENKVKNLWDKKPTIIVEEYDDEVFKVINNGSINTEFQLAKAKASIPADKKDYSVIRVKILYTGTPYVFEGNFKVKFR